MAFAIHKTAVPGFISANVALLTKGALKAMLWTKLKLLAVMLLTLTLIGTGSSLWAYRPAPEALAANEDDKPDQDKKRDDQDAPQKSKEKKSFKQSRAEEVVAKSFK